MTTGSLNRNSKYHIDICAKKKKPVLVFNLDIDIRIKINAKKTSSVFYLQKSAVFLFSIRKLQK